MEIFSFHKGLNKLVEIGNSSMCSSISILTERKDLVPDTLRWRRSFVHPTNLCIGDC